MRSTWLTFPKQSLGRKKWKIKNIYRSAPSDVSYHIKCWRHHSSWPVILLRFCSAFMQLLVTIANMIYIETIVLEGDLKPFNDHKLISNWTTREAVRSSCLTLVAFSIRLDYFRIIYQNKKPYKNEEDWPHQLLLLYVTLFTSIKNSNRNAQVLLKKYLTKEIN